MSHDVMDKKVVNSISLEISGQKLTVLDTSNFEFEYVIEFEGERTDDAQYKTRQDALNSLTDCDLVHETARWHFFEEGWKTDPIDIADYISANIETLSEEAGYKVEAVFKKEAK